MPHLGRTVRQQRARDRKRLGVFYSLGYRVVTVWESDWLTNAEKEIGRLA
jgi:G:T-mismatch repair DNA endonuclease (very short patch repair protein)